MVAGVCYAALEKVSQEKVSQPKKKYSKEDLVQDVEGADGIRLDDWEKILKILKRKNQPSIIDPTVAASPTDIPAIPTDTSVSVGKLEKMKKI